VAGLLIAVLLIASLLLIHFSMRALPMPRWRPLNVDRGLPLPEVGQASTVFSLTALFGAYFGIYLLLGLPALAGLAFGTALGLLVIRSWIGRRSTPNFEAFLSRVLQGPPGNAAVFGFALSAVQCAYATSELLILREIAKTALGLRSDHATILTIGLAIIGYFYVLFGGYMAVFRTDVLQFVLVAIMAAALCTITFRHGLPTGWTVQLVPRPGYWPMAFGTSRPLLYGYHFVIATVMGLGFLGVSPDAWKRVFIVAKLRKQTPLRFAVFLAVGTAPFVVLVLLGIPTGLIPDGPVNVGQMFSAMLASDLLFVAAALGLVASFLSSFDSALLASVQVGLILKRKRKRTRNETPRFHWLMVTVLMTIFFLFTGLRPLSNPYLLANVLLGAYAVIAGVELGTAGLLARLPENSLLWVLAVGGAVWMVYFSSELRSPSIPTTYQINTVPGGVLLCLGTALFCKVLTIGKRRNARH